MKNWLLRISAWLSQTINLFLLFGHHDQTVSARAYVNRNNKYWNKVYLILNKFFFVLLKQEDHCKTSFEEDIKFAQDILKLKDN